MPISDIQMVNIKIENHDNDFIIHSLEQKLYRLNKAVSAIRKTLAIPDLYEQKKEQNEKLYKILSKLKKMRRRLYAWIRMLKNMEKYEQELITHYAEYAKLEKQAIEDKLAIILKQNLDPTKISGLLKELDDTIYRQKELIDTIVKTKQAITDLNDASKKITSIIKKEHQEIEYDKKEIYALREELGEEQPELIEDCNKALISLSNIQDNYQRINEHMQDITADTVENSLIMQALNTSQEHIEAELSTTERLRQQIHGGFEQNAPVSRETIVDLFLSKESEQSDRDTRLLENLNKMKKEFNLIGDEIESLKKEEFQNYGKLDINSQPKEDIIVDEFSKNLKEIKECLRELSILQQQLIQISQRRKNLMEQISDAKERRNFPAISKYLKEIQELETESQKLTQKAAKTNRKYQEIRGDIISTSTFQTRTTEKKEILNGYDIHKKNISSAFKKPDHTIDDTDNKLLPNQPPKLKG